VEERRGTVAERRDARNEELDEQRRRASDEQQLLFGKWLEGVRKQAGLSQEECCNLARAHDLTFKMNKSDLSRIENGRTSLANLYEKIPALSKVLGVSPLLMYQKAYLKPPLSMEEAQTSPPLAEAASTEWERRAQYLEKLFVFCTNRVLVAMGQEEISVEDLAHLRPTAEELATLRAANEHQPSPASADPPPASARPVGGPL